MGNLTRNVESTAVKVAGRPIADQTLPGNMNFVNFISSINEIVVFRWLRASIYFLITISRPKVESNSAFANIFDEFREELDEKHDRNERIVKLSRDVTIGNFTKSFLKIQRVM